ncbi:trypsin-like peptidase domain-containing protein [Microlunatus elymi]|nr:trypsin-like peptidase domain-containing protein [Microlunatus elymi]
MSYPPPHQPYRPPARRSSGTGRMAAVLSSVALVALLVGGGAGYLGAKLAQPDASEAESPATNGPTQAAPAATHPPSPTASVPPTRNSVDTVRVAEQLLPSTVTIRISSGSATELGSGFVLDRHGRIMTNNHVVADAGHNAIWVTDSTGRRSKAKLVGRSPAYDLAVIQLSKPGGLRPATLGDSSTVRVGEAAVAVGSPLGLGGTVTEGIISAVNRPVAVGGTSAGGQAYLNALQTDAPINHGNSGGPLADGSGSVIGVNSAILTGSGSNDRSGNIGIGFAIPINQARQIAGLLIKNGYATYPVINATVSTDSQRGGVLMASITPGGAASKAGLKPEDLVTAIDGQRVFETDDLIVAIRNHRPGDTVRLSYQRDGDEHSAQLKLASERG